MTVDRAEMLRAVRKDLVGLAEVVSWLLDEESPAGHPEATIRVTPITPATIEDAFDEPDSFSPEWYSRHPELECVTLLVRIRKYPGSRQVARPPGEELITTSTRGNP